MKRAIMALTLAAIVGAGVYGLAASLSVTSGSLGAGNATVAACQSATINATWDATYSSSAPGYQATTVHLQHVDETAAKCGGKDYKVTVTGAGNAALGTEATGTLPTNAGGADSTVDITLTGVSAASVTGVHVTIAG